MFRILDKLRTSLLIADGLEDGERCIVLFLLHSLQPVSSLAIITPLQDGLRDVLHKHNHLWNTPECILANEVDDEGVTCCEQEHDPDSISTMFQEWYARGADFRQRQWMQQLKLDLLNPLHVQTLTDNNLYSHVRYECEEKLRVLNISSIRATFCWLQHFWVKSWLFMDGNVMEMQDTLDSCLATVMNSVPVVPSLDYDVDHVVISKDACMIELVCGLVLWRLKVFPGLSEDLSHAQAVHTCISSWYVRLEPYKQENRALYEQLLLAMALLNRLSAQDYQMQRDAYLSQVSLSSTENIWSSLRWLFLDAKMNQFVSRNSSSRQRNLDVDYSSSSFSETPYFWENFGQVYLAKSQICMTIDTGYGVFAATDFEKGDVICEYTGKLHTGCRVKSSPYMRAYEKHKKKYIDGNPDASQCNSRQIAQMIQDPMDTKFYNSGNMRLLATEVDPRFRKTLAVVTNKRTKPLNPEVSERLMEVATKQISKGQEIYTCYGYTQDEYRAFGMGPKELATQTLPSPKPVDILQPIMD